MINYISVMTDYDSLNKYKFRTFDFVLDTSVRKSSGKPALFSRLILIFAYLGLTIH